MKETSTNCLNFLAHIYLSFGHDEVSIGNFIADSVRGSDLQRFPEAVQKGIRLHRAIDTYTDTHPVTRQSSRRLHSRYSHYSRVIVDIYYDHFLASSWGRYSEQPLETFVDDFYSLLDQNFLILPHNVQRMIPYMVSDNWLVNYAELEGIGRVLKGMDRRTANRSGMDQAIEDLQEYYTEFEDEFHTFFKDLIIFSRQKLDSL